MNGQVWEDQIFIEGIEVECSIGVPDEERSMPQKLSVDLVFSAPFAGAAAEGDDFSKTVDYFLIYQSIHRVCGERPRKLIETLAEDISSRVLKEFPVESVEVTVRKFILPATKSVGVKIKRTKNKKS